MKIPISVLFIHFCMVIPEITLVILLKKLMPEKQVLLVSLFPMFV